MILENNHKNIAILLAGGIGARFGSKLPKQFLNLCGRPLINYSMTDASKSKTISDIVISIDNQYINYIEEKDNPSIHYVPPGIKGRADGVKNALNYIKDNFPQCENIIILQAVTPFFNAELVDKYISLLDEYDVVTTAQKCPGEIFEIDNYHKIDRNKYYFCQSPEAFKFKDLYENIDVDSPYSELIYHYSFEPKVCFFTDFKYNVKVTYQSDLDYSEFLVKKNCLD